MRLQDLQCFPQKHLRCLGSRLACFAAGGARRKRRHRGRKGNRGNSLGTTCRLHPYPPLVHCPFVVPTCPCPYPFPSTIFNRHCPFVHARSCPPCLPRMPSLRPALLVPDFPFLFRPFNLSFLFISCRFSLTFPFTSVSSSSFAFVFLSPRFPISFRPSLAIPSVRATVLTPRVCSKVNENFMHQRFFLEKP